VRYQIRHTFKTDADTFWTKVFFDPEYNSALFERHLKFSVYRVLTLDKQPDGSVHRRVECAPPVEIPAVAKKIIGDSTSYVEDGRFDPKSKRFNAEVHLKAGGDKIKTKVSIWVEPRGDKQVERIAEVDNEVKVFGVGKILETFIEKQMRESYDESAAFTHKWIADRGL
jgi:Protein of unknown function (DUF2505)